MTGTTLLIALVVATGSVIPTGAGTPRIPSSTAHRPTRRILEPHPPRNEFRAGAGDHALHATRNYRVRPGETLWTIARKEYGSAAAWSDLYRLNRTAIGSDPADLRPGTVLVLSARSPVAPARHALPAASHTPVVRAAPGPARSTGRQAPPAGLRDPFEFGGAPHR